MLWRVFTKKNSYSLAMLLPPHALCRQWKAASPRGNRVGISGPRILEARALQHSSQNGCCFLLVIPAHLPTLGFVETLSFLGNDPSFFTITGVSVAGWFCPVSRTRIPGAWDMTNSMKHMSLPRLPQQHDCFLT